MKLFRYVGAVVLTIILLFIARNLSMVKPTDLKESVEGLTIEHTTVPKIVEGNPDKITAKISNPAKKEIKVYLLTSLEETRDVGKFTGAEMQADESGNYSAPIPILSKGKKIFYYINVRDVDGREIIQLPTGGSSPVKVKYEGKVAPYIVIPHIFLMFVTIFFASLALFDAFRVGADSVLIAQMAKNLRWATVALFLGGYPFGWAMNYFAFGMMWEGIPFGWDFTDNKTQIAFLYLIFLNLSMLGTLYNNRFGKNNFSDKSLGWFTVVGYLLVAAIYIIPHSIQFSIPATALFSYGLTAVVVGLYTFGLTRKQKWIERKSHK